MRIPTICFALVCLGIQSLAGAENYEYGPNSKVKEGVPQGTLTKHIWKSDIFEGTRREYYVYVPQQYDPAVPASVMVFQDGHTFIKSEGDYRAPTVFDNLIHQGEIPVTIGIFINPGHRGDSFPDNRWRANNRSVEYDTLGGKYARFLTDEILPEVSRRYNLSSSPKDRAICGNSSGGICAFTVAWERPDAFGRVVSHIGSFTNIRGGHAYPYLIRKTERKSIKVFLQDGVNDLNNRHGNWPLGNLQMESALKFMGYDNKMVWGTGAHNGNHGGAIFPDTLRWIWND